MSEAPTPQTIGIGIHGRVAREDHRIRGAWCLHLYRDPMRLRVSGEWFEITPGSVTLIPPDAPIEFHFARPTTHIHVFAHFRAHGVETRPFRAHTLLGDEFETHFGALHEAVGWFGTEPMRVAARLWELLWQLADNENATTNHDRSDHTMTEALVRRAREKIELQLSENLSVAALARELGVSHNHLTRSFRAATGSTVVEFICARRVQRAIYLLEHTTWPVKAVAAQVGLGDLHALNKVLRRETGRSPRAWRNAAHIRGYEPHR